MPPALHTCYDAEQHPTRWWNRAKSPNTPARVTAFNTMSLPIMYAQAHLSLPRHAFVFWDRMLPSPALNRPGRGPWSKRIPVLVCWIPLFSLPTERTWRSSSANHGFPTETSMLPLGRERRGCLQKASCLTPCWHHALLFFLSQYTKQEVVVDHRHDDSG